METRMSGVIELCEALMILGIDHSSSNVCKFDLWIGDRYLVSVTPSHRVILTDMMMATCGNTMSEGFLFQGSINELLSREDLVERLRKDF